MGFTPEDSVTDGHGRTSDVRNLWICDGSLFRTGGIGFQQEGILPFQNLSPQDLSTRLSARQASSA
jgi:hypothetical protein